MISALDIVRIAIAICAVIGAAIAIERQQHAVSAMLSILGLLAIAALFA